jgi:hypothetical protein
MSNNFDSTEVNKLLSFLIEGKIIPSDVLPSAEKVLKEDITRK